MGSDTNLKFTLKDKTVKHCLSISFLCKLFRKLCRKEALGMRENPECPDLGSAPSAC
jgi:hypothetical protein